MGVKLIVVDDDQEVRLLTVGFLVDAGFRILQADCGAQALVLLSGDPCVRMIVSDIRMPEMSGIELAEEAVRRFPTLRVVLISGFTDPQQRVRWPFLKKPFRASGLCNLVATEMERK